MRRLTAVLAILACLVIGACDGGSNDDAAPESGDESPSASPTTDLDPGAFTAEPALTEDFSESSSGWSGGRYRNGSYTVSVGRDEEFAAAPAPLEISPGTTGVLVQADVALPKEGRVGLFCRRSAGERGGYAIAIDPRGAFEILRMERGGLERVRGEPLQPGLVEPGRSAHIRLVCGTGPPGEPVTIALTVNQSPLLGGRDDFALPVADKVRAGLLALDPGTSARFDRVSISLAE